MKYKVCFFRGNDIFILSEQAHLTAARRDVALCGKLLNYMSPATAGTVKIIMEDDA